MNAGRAFQIIAFLVASCVSAAGEEKRFLPPHVDAAQIEVSLVPDKSEICLGEPLHLSFIVKNKSDRSLQLSVGGDGRNDIGRPITFSVVVKSEPGATLPPREVTRDWGGLGGAERIPPLGSYSFRLFLPHWALVKEPGVYRITARRILRFYTETEGKLDEVPEEASARLTVTPASREKLGELITALGDKVIAARNDNEEAWQALLAIDDDRVVPIFRKALEKEDSSAKCNALEGLAKFKTDEAFDGLKRGMAAEIGNVRHYAAGFLSESPHAGALPLLLAQRHDKYYAVRMTVLHAIAQKLDRAQALPLLQEMAADKNEQVSEEARRQLKRLSTP